jgi:DNA-binding response OmpR family regulator
MPTISGDTVRGAAPTSHHVAHEHAVLRVLYEQRHRVVGRMELARAAGLAELSERRCDSVLVSVRRVLGPRSIITVRSRGWRLAPEAAADAAQLLERADA